MKSLKILLFLLPIWARENFFRKNRRKSVPRGTRFCPEFLIYSCGVCGVFYKAFDRAILLSFSVFFKYFFLIFLFEYRIFDRCRFYLIFLFSRIFL